MIEFSDIEKYLPQYLSKEASENLFAELKDFPKNIDDRLYTKYLADNKVLYQGDGISGLIGINLPDTRTGDVPGIVISNTCDINPENERPTESRLVYATIFKLEKYKDLLIQRFVNTGQKTEESINAHIEKIKEQYISHIFYLPAGAGLENESIVLLDRLNNLPNNYIQNDNIPKQRLFTLSDYGFYLFLYKLSIHFTRIRESVSRSEDVSVVINV